MPMSQFRLTEETPAAPVTFHGAMHLAREIAFQSDVAAPLTILRPTLIYGPKRSAQRLRAQSVS